MRARVWRILRLSRVSDNEFNGWSKLREQIEVLSAALSLGAWPRRFRRFLRFGRPTLPFLKGGGLLACVDYLGEFRKGNP